jgi:hypothetical protein
MRVRVTAHAGERVLIRERVGVCSAQQRDVGACHDQAAKGAETDALKRALRTFGNPFGVALYDPSGDQVGVSATLVAHQAAEAEPTAPSLDERLVELRTKIGNARSSQELARLRHVHRDWVQTLGEDLQEVLSRGGGAHAAAHRRAEAEPGRRAGRRRQRRRDADLTALGSLTRGRRAGAHVGARLRSLVVRHPTRGEPSLLATAGAQARMADAAAQRSYLPPSWNLMLPGRPPFPAVLQAIARA